MRVVAVYAWSRDPGSALVGDDGTVTWRTDRTAPGEDDHAVLAVARSLADGDELVGVTLGKNDPGWGLARGADRALVVPDAPQLLDDAATAALLAAAVRRAGDADVVVVADAEENPGVGPALGAELGRVALAGVLDASVLDGRVHARRRVGDVEETVSAAPPLVLAVAAVAAEAKAPGMKELLTARKRPVEQVPVAELGLAQGAPLEARETRRPASTSARLLPGDPDEAARALVAALRAEGVLA